MNKITDEQIDSILKEFKKTRNIRPRTIAGYKDTLKIYTNFHGVSFNVLLNEAEMDEENQIIWKRRKLKKRLTKFKVYLEKHYLLSSAKTHFTRIKSLYCNFGIEIGTIQPFNIKNSRTNPPISFYDLPNKDIIKNAIMISNPIMKAIILFMFSSGCAKAETLNLTIQDFINATKEYHDKNDIYDLLILLKGRDDIVPMFKLKRQKTNKFYYAFCSNEACNEIINHLMHIKKPLTPDMQLFKINYSYLGEKFTMLSV